MKKIVEITNCSSCTHIYQKFGVGYFCRLANRKTELNLFYDIPSWCPLPDVFDDEIGRTKCTIEGGPWHGGGVQLPDGMAAFSTIAGDYYERKGPARFVCLGGAKE